MAIRLFRPRQPRDQRKDPTRLASVSKPVSTVRVVRSGVQKEPAIVDTVVDTGGSDPYNSAGRHLADTLRQRRYD